MKREEFHTLLDSRENINILIGYLIENPKHIDQLIAIGLCEQKKESWRAIWIADKIHEKKPELIRPYIDQMIAALETTNNDSKLRHLMKLISLNTIPRKKLSFLLDLCIREFSNAERPTAIRVHAMQILFEISENEPDFKPELVHLIEHEMEHHASAGINARGKNLLKKLRKNI